jgi:multiple sugar transport system substrate-binding protein
MTLLVPLAKVGAVHVTKLYAWQNDFIAGKAAFAISTIASYPFLAKPIGTTFKFNEAPFPGGPGGQFTTLYGTNLAIFKGADTDTQSAAWDYMKFLTSSDANSTFVQQTGYMPIRQSTFNSAQLQAYYAKTPAHKVGPQQINNVFVASTLPAWDQCRTIITTNYTSVLAGQMAPDVGTARSGQQCTAVLAQG